MKMALTEKWKLGYNPGVTGATTPSPNPFSGKDWPYLTINVGRETIAVVPAQDENRQVGKHGIQNTKAMKTNESYCHSNNER